MHAMLVRCLTYKIPLLCHEHQFFVSKNLFYFSFVFSPGFSDDLLIPVLFPTEEVACE